MSLFQNAGGSHLTNHWSNTAPSSDGSMPALWHSALSPSRPTMPSSTSLTTKSPQWRFASGVMRVATPVIIDGLAAAYAHRVAGARQELSLEAAQFAGAGPLCSPSRIMGPSYHFPRQPITKCPIGVGKCVDRERVGGHTVDVVARSYLAAEEGRCPEV